MIPLPVQFLLLMFAGWVNRQHQGLITYRQAENHVRREQLGGKRLEFTDAQRSRLARVAHPIGRCRLREIGTIVTPDTLLRWYRELVARKYDGSRKRGPGRPRIACGIQRLIVEMARERVGATRASEALSRTLGYSVGRNTIKRVSLENGIDPAELRGTAWATFLRAHWGAIAATDLFTVEVVTWRGLLRYFVIFVIDLKTRRVAISGIARSPDGVWMSQIARNLTDFRDGFLREARFLIHDRDPLFTREFRRTLKRSGIRLMRLPARSPNLNAHAERFVRLIKSECLAQIIPLGERHLRRAVREYAEHYHHERNHRGLGNQLIDSDSDLTSRRGPVACRRRLGGTLNYYRRPT
jgi:transposase InsO family protein